MNLEQDLAAILSGQKELDSSLEQDLKNALGNPVEATLFFALIKSHVAVAKQAGYEPSVQSPAELAAFAAAQAKAAQEEAAAAVERANQLAIQAQQAAAKAASRGVAPSGPA